MKKLTIGLLCGALLLAGCAGLTAAQISTQTVQDLNLIGQGLSALTPELTAIPGITSAEIATVTTDLQSAESIASAVNTGLTINAGASQVEQIEVAVNDAIGAIAALPLPANVSAGLTAVRTLLATAEVALNVLGAPTAAPNAETPDQARAALHALIGH